MKTFGQYYEYLSSKIEKQFKEKKFNRGGVQLHYILRKHVGSDKLIVVFSACTRKGIKARYNYMRTLAKCSENQLYILDDFGFDGRGAYYLGKEGGTEIEETCEELIKDTINKIEVQQVFFCGTSKGAWAALDFMPRFEGSIAIVGAPQYKLGNYLMAPSNEITGNYVLPGKDKDSVELINNHLPDRLRNGNQKSHKVYLHYSDSEHTYEEHIVYLLNDLSALNYKTQTDISHYSDHWDVGKYYPQYLLESLNLEGCKVSEN